MTTSRLTSAITSGKDTRIIGSNIAASSGIAGNKEARTGDKETGIGQIFDADKVQKEISAQVQITQEFGRQAGRAVDDYTEKQMSTLRERYAAETDPEKQQALQAEVDQLRLETHVLNVLIGGVTGMGGIALTKESLSAAARNIGSGRVSCMTAPSSAMINAWPVHFELSLKALSTTLLHVGTLVWIFFSTMPTGGRLSTIWAGFLSVSIGRFGRGV